MGAARLTLGLLMLLAVLFYSEPYRAGDLVKSLGIIGAGGWLLFYLLGRGSINEATFQFVVSNNLALSRANLFWISSIRVAVNQALPASGLLIFAQTLRRLYAISWSEVVALTSLQATFLLALVGLIGGLASVSLHPNIPFTVAMVFLMCFIIGAMPMVLAATTLPWKAISRSYSVDAIRTSLNLLLQDKKLCTFTLIWNSIALFARGGRLLLLFFIFGHIFPLREAIVLVCVVEISMIFQITPGSLGLREGAIVYGASVAGVPIDTAASIALIDRAFLIFYNTLFGAIGVFALKVEKGGARINEKG